MTTRFTRFVLALALVLPLHAWAAPQQIVEIEVQGLTCPFCVYGLSKNLRKAPGVSKADVDLEAKRARIELVPGQKPDVELYKRIVRDSGFTPGDVRVQTIEE